MGEKVIRLIQSQNLQALQEFLVDYPRGLDVADEAGVWALHYVMEQGNLELVQYVTEYAIVNMNLIDREGNTVLHYGVKSGNLEVVKYLVERVDSPVTQANLKGETPLDWAVRLGRTEIRAYLEETLGTTADRLYHNPICRGMHPDPSIVRVGEDYYMVNSSFVFFPCIPISHSRDLIHWKIIGHAITNPDWAGLKGLEGGRGCWAADISYNEGKFYITATYRLNEGGMPQRLQMVTSAEKPQGPYCKPVFLKEEGIDPSIFTDVDGRRYMLLNRGARIFEISKDGTKILSKPRLLWYGQNKKASEGPHLIYKDGYYYLFMAEGGTGMGHRITVARSKTLMGVYESCPYNPILRQWDEKRLIQCSGHGMPVETQNGDWYMVYLCNRIGTSGYAMLGRETSLDPIRWTEDGWPLVNGLQGPSELQKKPVLLPEEAEEKGEKGKREAEKPEQEKPVYEGNPLWSIWRTVRGTTTENYRQDNDTVIIRGNGLDLNTLDYSTLLVKPQTEFVCSMEGSVKLLEGFLEEKDWDAGLTCYYDESSFLKLGLACRQGKTGILAAGYVDDRYVTEKFLPLQDFPLSKGETEIRLRIDTAHLKRTLFYGQGEAWKQAAVFENTSYLSSEGLKKGKRFTGAMQGIYVHGKITAQFQVKDSVEGFSEE